MNKKPILLSNSFAICNWVLSSLIIGFVVVIFSNCHGSNPTNSCADKQLDENCCPQIDSLEKPLPKPDYSVVNIFLETSGSMKGYMPNDTPGTDFQKIIPEILSNLNTEKPGQVKFYSIYNSNQPFESLDLSTARNKIQYGKFEWSGSTYLPSMLDSVLKGYQKEEAVNIFISDCIYSPEKKDQKNVDLAQTDFRDIIKPYITYSTTIFSLLSDFRVKKTSMSTKSPYYLVLQGKPQNVYAIEKLLINSFNSYSQNFQEINFGLNYPKPFYSVLPYTEISGNFISFPCNSSQNSYLSIQEISLADEKDSLQFWIGLDLKDLPAYAKELTYLNSNSILNIENGNGKIVSIIDKPPVSIVQDDKKISSQCTHFLKIKITRLEDPVARLSISLKYSRTNWIAQVNEPQNEDNRSKTFRFEKLISGFEQGYDQNNIGYFYKNLPIALIKK